MSYFLSKIAGRSVDALFCVPCGCTQASREKYYRVAKAAGISRVGFAEVPYLAALGHNVPLSESNPVFTIDVGAGKTSVAAFSLDGIIAGLTMNVGGMNMDVHIIDHIAELFNLKIGALSSEKLKNTVGSLIPNDCQSAVVTGQDITTGRPRAVSVTSENVLLPIRNYVDTILGYAELILKKLPAEVSAATCKNGVYLSGGVANLAGFSDYVAERLQMDAHMPNDQHMTGDPQMTVVLGGGRAIGNPSLLKRIAME